MINHFHWLVMDGKPSKDFDVYTSGDGTYLSPERSFEEVEVPGRNGSIFLYDDNYKNVDVTYSAWIGKNEGHEEVDKNLRSLRSFLLSREGYFKLEDTYHPDEFRFATYNAAIEPEVHPSFDAVQFDLTFSCKPQRFLKNYYDIPVEYGAGNTTYKFYNETYLKARPLIRLYGTGRFSINSVSITVNSAVEYTDIDCDLQEAYKDTLSNNCNQNIQLTKGEFPYLKPGDNQIMYSSTFTRVVMYPRLFVL